MLKMSRKPSKKLAKLVLASLLFTGGAQLAISPSVAEASEVVTKVTGATYTGGKWIFNPEGSMIQSKNDDYAFIPADTNTTVLNLDGDWSISQSIFGHEEGGSSDVSGYTVNLNGPGIRVRLYGAKAIGGGNATDNHVKVITGTVNAIVAGGFSDKGSAIGNSVEIEGGTFSRSYGTGVAGGVSDAHASGNANQNTVIIKGGIFEKDVDGGLVLDPIGSGNANENRVTISGGEIGTSESGNIRGGYGSYGAANNNTVEISGGKINRNVYGGESNGGEASGNTVTISGNPTFAADSSIYGAVSRIGNTQNNTVNILASGLKIKSLFGGLVYDVAEGGTSSGNTLNIAATGVTAGSVDAFQIIALSTGDIDIGNGEKAASSLKFQDGATVLSSSSFKNADGSNFTGTLDITKTDFTGTGKMTLLASGTNDNFTTLKLAYDDATKTNPKTLDATTPSVVVKSGGDETLSNKVVLTTTGGITHTVSLDTTNTYRNVLYTIAGDGNVTVTKVDLKNWDGTTHNLTDAYKGTSVPVATGSFTEPTEDATILTAPTETFFGEVTGDRAYTSGASTPVTSKGVTISGNKTGGVRVEDSGKTLKYYAESIDVQTVNLGAMTWNDGLVAATGYGFAGVTSINAKDLAFTFTDEQKKGLSKESNMALVSDATGLTAGKTVTNPTVTQTVSYDVNGAALSGTLTGTVSTAAGAVNYAATGMTLDSVDLAKWDGATASAVPAGWTKNDSGVTVATENMNNLPETSKVILVTDTANYFSDAKISETNKYKAYDFTPSAANGVTLSGKQSKGVRTAENGKKLEYAVGKMLVSDVSFGEMKWGTGRAATTDYDFANTATVKATDLSFTFTDEQKAALSKTSKMTLLSDATNLAADKTVTGESRTQQVDFSVANGAVLTGTLTGTVSTAAGAVNYAATGMTLDSVNLAKWDGAATSSVPDGWTANASGVTVATENMNNLPETSKVILVTDTANYFSDDKISEKNKYQAYDFTPSAANGVTLSGKQSKGVRTAENGKKLEYAVGKMDVSEISFGTMDWGTSRAATTDYDFAKVATVNASDLAFNFTDEQKADLSGTSTMTLLSDATNLAADKTVTGASRSQQIDYSVANGADLTGTLTGTVSTAAGAVNYNATSMTLDSVDLANWDGATTSAVPKGWTAADKSVAVNNADAITVTPTKTQAILTAESGMFQDVNVAKTPVAFDPVTENGVTLTGTKTNSIQTTKTKVDNDTVSYVVGKKDVKSIAIGAIEWGGKALDGSSADYNYEAASVDSSKFDISNPEKVEANVAKILLEANDTLKDMTKDVNASYNDYEVTTGVLMNGMITGSLSKSGNNIVFAAAENKATDLTFGKVEWTGSNPLIDHKATLPNVSFDGATVDTSNIDFYKEMYIEADQTTTLVSDFGGTPKEIKGSKYMVGTAFDGEGSATMENGNLVFRTKTSAGVSEQTHKAVMGVEATMGLLASGIGHLDKVLDGFGNVSNAGSDGASTSASIGGGKDRYETGSHVNINSWSAAVGVGARKETKKGTLQYGIFGEYGKGNYTMHSDVGRSDGDAHYAGGGLMAKWTNKHDVYTEASFRLGRVSDSANDLLRDGAGNAYGYDIHATYYGAHVGLGKVFNYKGGKSLDVYGKFFYTKRDGAEFDAKQHYNLDSVNSSVLRIGARYGTTDKKWNWYGGLAYEYEFDGEAKGTVNGTEIRAASIKGSSVRGEFGMRMDATKDNPWRTDISIYGYGGKHRGFGGSVNVAYTF